MSTPLDRFHNARRIDLAGHSVRRSRPVTAENRYPGDIISEYLAVAYNGGCLKLDMRQRGRQNDRHR